MWLIARKPGIRYVETFPYWKEVETIAYSCGVAEPRSLGRKHCRQVMDDGSSARLDERYAAS